MTPDEVEYMPNAAPTSKKRFRVSLGRGLGLVGVVATLAMVIGVASGVAAPFNQTSSVLRINAGGGAFTDSKGRVWQADRGYIQGDVSSTQEQIKGALDGNSGNSDEPLYQSERWGMGGYHLPVANGTYWLKLYFAEIAPGVPKRVFSVTAENKPVVTDLNIREKVGVYTADVESSKIVITDGALDLEFTSSAARPKISGIELIATAAAPTTTTSTTKQVVQRPLETVRAAPSTTTSTLPAPTTTTSAPEAVCLPLPLSSCDVAAKTSGLTLTAPATQRPAPKPMRVQY